MITIFGLGFVGLTTGLAFAKKGFMVYGFDVDQNRLNSLKKYKIPFHEPHLVRVLKETNNKTFSLDTNLEIAIKNSEAIFLCVGTPGKQDGSVDLGYIFTAIEQILSAESDKYQVIIAKSTVPPATVSNEIIPFVERKLKHYPNRKIGFASNPEFLREGHCWEDFTKPARIVIGVEDEKPKPILTKIYQPFSAPIHYVSYNTAEFVKYLSNALLSTLISFANEMSIIANKIGEIDIPKAFKILHEDIRWSGEPAEMSKYVYPGCGYGGYCLPKDTAALAQRSKEYGYTPKILEANLDVNANISEHVANTIGKRVTKPGPIGILGLSFKPNSNDVRITPTKSIILHLLNKGYTKLFAYDPISNSEFRKSYPEINISYCETLDEILSKTDNVAILTGWEEFKEQQKKIQTKNVFDFRYIY